MKKIYRVYVRWIMAYMISVLTMTTLAFDPYSVLKVPKNALASDIYTSYDTQVKAFHATMSNAKATAAQKKVAIDHMKQVNQAYEILSNKKKRDDYDAQEAKSPHKSIDLDDDRLTKEWGDPTTYYDMLDVPHNASGQQIEEGYRKQSAKWGAPAWKNASVADQAQAAQYMKQVAEAHSVLSDSGKKASYDSALQYQVKGVAQLSEGNEGQDSVPKTPEENEKAAKEAQAKATQDATNKTTGSGAPADMAIFVDVPDGLKLSDMVRVAEALIPSIKLNPKTMPDFGIEEGRFYFKPSNGYIMNTYYNAGFNFILKYSILNYKVEFCLVTNWDGVGSKNAVEAGILSKATVGMRGYGYLPKLSLGPLKLSKSEKDHGQFTVYKAGDIPHMPKGSKAKAPGYKYSYDFSPPKKIDGLFVGCEISLDHQVVYLSGRIGLDLGPIKMDTDLLAYFSPNDIFVSVEAPIIFGILDASFETNIPLIGGKFKDFDLKVACSAKGLKRLEDGVKQAAKGLSSGAQKKLDDAIKKLDAIDKLVNKINKLQSDYDDHWQRKYERAKSEYDKSKHAFDSANDAHEKYEHYKRHCGWLHPKDCAKAAYYKGKELGEDALAGVKRAYYKSKEEFTKVMKDVAHAADKMHKYMPDILALKAAKATAKATLKATQASLSAFSKATTAIANAAESAFTLEEFKFAEKGGYFLKGKTPKVKIKGKLLGKKIDASMQLDMSKYGNMVVDMAKWLANEVAKGAKSIT